METRIRLYVQQNIGSKSTLTCPLDEDSCTHNIDAIYKGNKHVNISPSGGRKFRKVANMMARTKEIDKDRVEELIQ